MAKLIIFFAHPIAHGVANKIVLILRRRTWRQEDYYVLKRLCHGEDVVVVSWAVSCALRFCITQSTVPYNTSYVLFQKIQLTFKARCDIPYDTSYVLVQKISSTQRISAKPKRKTQIHHHTQPLVLAPSTTSRRNCNHWDSSSISTSQKLLGCCSAWSFPV